MVFENSRITRLKNHVIDYNENTIVNFPFGLAPVLADKFITDIKIADDANISWGKINKAGSKLTDISEIVLANLQQNQVLGWDGINWVNKNLPTQTNPWDPDKVETVTHKTIDYNANTILNLPFGTAIKLPDGSATSRNSVGTFWGGAGNGSGLLSGMTINGVSITTEQTASEQYTVFNSDVVDGEVGGFSSVGKITRRDYNPTYKIKWHTVSSSERLFIGLADIDIASLTGDDAPLDSHNGAGILFSDTVDNYTVMWNNGAASQQSFTTTTPKDTLAHTLIITLDNTAATVTVTFDGTVVVNSSTAIPAATTGMYMHSNYESIGTSGAVMAVSYAYLLQDH